MNKRVIQIILSIVLYISAGLLMIYAIWSYTYCADIISQARLTGQLAVSGNEYDIVSFYMNNSGQYAVLALLLTAAGLILQRVQPVQNTTDSALISTKNEAADNELDEWFNEVEQDSE